MRECHFRLLKIMSLMQLECVRGNHNYNFSQELKTGLENHKRIMYSVFETLSFYRKIMSRKKNMIYVSLCNNHSLTYKIFCQNNNNNKKR